MIYKKGFESEVYLQEQAAAISRRLSLFPDRLYLEFGGKILKRFPCSPGLAWL